MSPAAWTVTISDPLLVKEGVTCMDATTFETLPLLLTVEELASVLRIGRNPAYQLVKEGNIQSIRVGRSIRIPRNALIQFVERTHQ